jgi:PPOX class probable F420-dependent enzyme
VTEEQARERFAGARVARLATADAQGRPHVVPVVFAVDPDDDRIYIVVDAKPKRTTALKRLRNVQENPAVSVVVDQYDDEDWDALWWVRADGQGRVVEPDDEEGTEAIAQLRAKHPQQRPTGAVLVIEVERWSGWSATPGA